MNRRKTSPWARRSAARLIGARWILAGAVAATGVAMSCDRPAMVEAQASERKPRRISDESAEQRIVPTVVPPSARVLSVEEAVAHREPVEASRALVRFRPEGSPCAGYFVEGPSFSLQVDAPGTFFVGAVSQNETDMVLALQRPDGSWVCNDDWASSSDPGAVVDLEAGLHHVYFGAYARMRALAYTPRVEKTARPRWERCEGSTVLEARADDAVQTVEGRITDDMHACQSLLEAPNCGWFLTGTPVVCIDLQEEALLTVSTERADFDTVLALQAIEQRRDGPVRGSARLFNDDISPENAHSQVEALTQPGRYAVFVGSYRHRTEGSYHVRIHARPQPIEIDE